jgi:hypothetical protein
MKRSLMAAAVFVFVASIGRSEYVVIRVNLNATSEPGETQPGVPKMKFGPMDPSGATGSPDGTTGDTGSPDGARGMPKRGGGDGEDKMKQMQERMGQYMQKGPSMMMAGGKQGPGGPGMGMQGGYYGGMGGMGKAGQPGGGKGMMGMYGGMGFGGMKPPGSGGVRGQFPRSPLAGDAPADQVEAVKPAWFIAVVDADSVAVNKDGLYQVKHKWGTSLIPPAIGNNAVKVDVIDRRKVPPLDQRVLRQRTKLGEEEGGTELGTNGLLRLADWMLRHWNLPTDQRFAMRAEFDKLIDQLAAKDAKNPKVQALVAAREHIGKELPSPEAELSHLKGLVGEGKHRVARSEHYAILHQPRDERAGNVELVRLEHLYAGYFYWFALQGKPLTPPGQKLMAVLSGDLQDFQQLHELFDNLPLVADGFYSRFDNVAVYSSTRIDGPFQQFQGMVTNLDRQGLELNKLLRGEPLKGFEDELVTYGRTLALGLRAAQEEGDVATVSHEAVQQLAVATHVFPRRVHTPLAVKFGLGSFFETPKSDGLIHTMSYWSGIGAPSWTYLPIFKKIMEAEGSKTKELTFADSKAKIEPVSILKIITDQGVTAVEKANPKEQSILFYKSRSEAWALTYFLAKQRLDQLLKFYAELGRLPRDMELTEEVVVRAFARAFELFDAADANKVDPAKLAKLEAAWREFMKYEELELNPLPEPKFTAPEKPKETKPQQQKPSTKPQMKAG